MDSLHGTIWVVGAVVGSFTSQYWYSCLTRLALISAELCVFVSSLYRRNTIFVNMLIEVVASVLMIIPLEIYHGYDRGDPLPIAIVNALENQDLAITLFYLSRFLSGWGAGKYSLT